MEDGSLSKHTEIYFFPLLFSKKFSSAATGEARLVQQWYLFNFSKMLFILKKTTQKTLA